MKKKTVLCVIFILSFLLAGIILITVSLLSLREQSTTHYYVLAEDFRYFDIDVSSCEVSFFLSDYSYIEISGYRETEIDLSYSSGRVNLKERDGFFDVPIKVSGIGNYLTEGKRLPETRSVKVFLSQEDLKDYYNIVLHDSSLINNLSLEYCTIQATDSSISLADISFKKLSLELENCNTNLSINMPGTAFSRTVNAYNMDFSLNGDSMVNCEQYVVDKNAPEFFMSAISGKCALNFLKEE